MVRKYLAVALALTSSTTLMAADVVIDNFMTDKQTWVDTDVTLSAVDGGDPDIIIGDHRTLIVDIDGVPILPGSTSGAIGSDAISGPADGILFASFSAIPSEPPTKLTLEYLGSMGMGFSEVDLSGGGMNDRMRFFFASLDEGSAIPVGSGVDLDITLMSTGGGTATLDTAILDAPIDPFVFDAFFGDFTTMGGFDITKVTGIVIDFNMDGITNIDFELTEIRATVPEPGTYALLGGFMALLAFARRNAKKGPSLP